MARDPGLWSLARLACGGDIGLSPAPGCRGRFAALRLAWAHRVQGILNLARLLRETAMCPFIDPDQAIEYLNRANRLESGTSGKDGVSEEQLLSNWSRLTHTDMSTPEGRNKVYAAVAQMTKNEVEARAKAEQARREALAKTRMRPRPGSLRRGRI